MGGKSWAVILSRTFNQLKYNIKKIIIASLSLKLEFTHGILNSYVFGSKIQPCQIDNETLII